MMFVPFLILPLELFVFFGFANQYGFFKTLFFYFLPSIFGFAFLSFQARRGFSDLQKQMFSGQRLPNPLMKMFTRTLVGVFLILPFFSTRVLGFVLLIPGVSFILSRWAQAWIAKKIQNGSVFVMGQMGGMSGEKFSPASTFPGEREAVPATDDDSGTQNANHRVIDVPAQRKD